MTLSKTVDGRQRQFCLHLLQAGIKQPFLPRAGAREGKRGGDDASCQTHRMSVRPSQR